MAHVVIMPRLGNTVESCVIVKWRAPEGTVVTAETVLCEIETDKATMDVPAGSAGVVLKILHAEGDDVPVLEPIAVIGTADEDWRIAASSAGSGTMGTTDALAGSDTLGAAQAGAGAKTDVPAPSAGPASSLSPTTAAPKGISPRARALAGSEAVDPTSLSGSGPGGRIIERDIREAIDARPGLTAAAKSFGPAAGLPDWGGALGGRVRVADLGTAEASAHAVREAELQAGAGMATFPARSVPETSPTAASEYPGPYVDAPLKSIRKIIAERMSASLRNSAQLTFNSTAPAERVLALRARLKASGEPLGLSGVTVGDLVLFAVSRLLADHPTLNAHFRDGILRTFSRVHLGVAVDTPRGLMVPVIRNADLLSLGALSAESKRLAKACVEGRANPDELSGSTFTVSNLGAFGIESFTPVLNSPETGILGVDAVVPRAVPGPDGGVQFEKRLGLSLTVDHQIVDGANAARFLRDLAAVLADIDLLIAK